MSVVDARRTGVVSIGTLMKVFSLGGDRFVVVYHINEPLSQQTFDQIESDLRSSLGTEYVLLVASNNVEHSTFTALADSPDFQELVRAEVAKQLREAHWMGEV